MLFMLFVMS